MLRVLEPGGLVAIRSPDWGGFIVGPEIPGLQSAIDSYADLQIANGGDIHIGRKLPRLYEHLVLIPCAFLPPMIALNPHR
jgi:hypothetical protein